MKLLFLSVVSGFFCLKMVLICIYNIHCYGIGVSALSNSYEFYVHLYSCATILHCLSSDTLAHSLPSQGQKHLQMLKTSRLYLLGYFLYFLFSEHTRTQDPGIVLWNTNVGQNDQVMAKVRVILAKFWYLCCHLQTTRIQDPGWVLWNTYVNQDNQVVTMRLHNGGARPINNWVFGKLHL